MSDVNNQPGAAGAEGAQAEQPAAQQPQYLTRADFEAASKAQADALAKMLTEQFGAFRGQVIEEAVSAATRRGKPAPAARPAAPAPPTAPPPTAKPWEEDPAYKALLTKSAEQEQRTAALQAEVESQRKAREAAEEAARQSAKEQAVMRELTDIDNPHHTTEERARLASELLLRRGVIRYGAKDQKLYMSIPGEGGDKTVTLREGVRHWLNTEEGRQFRPAPPSGAGTVSGGWGGPPSASGTASDYMTPAERFSVALQKQNAMQGFPVRRPTN